MSSCYKAFPLRLILARIIDVPLPTHRLASSALQALQVDAELSPLVRRSFLLASREIVDSNESDHAMAAQPSRRDQSPTILRTTYEATTNRMLRVAVNGFMESMGVVLQVMEELDVDVLEP